MSWIRDLFAKKPEPTELVQEVAKPSATGLTAISPVRQPVATTLTPEGLGALLARADRGDVKAYFTLAAELEERDPQIATVLSTRKLAVTSLPVHVESASDEAHDIAIAEHVEQLVKNPAFEGLMLDLLDGISKGFSASEIVWRKDSNVWTPERYEYRPQHHFQFDSETLSKPRLRSLANPMEGDELAYAKWLVHTPKLRSGIPLQTGLLRPLAVCYAAKRFTLQQLLIFLETIGIPIRLGKYPSHMADQKKALLSAVRQIGTDTAAVIPQEMTVEFLESKNASGNSDVFLASAAYWDAQIAKIVLGQSLTTEASGSSGAGSYALGNVHNDVRKDIRNADARQLAATINRDLVRVFVDLNYGAQKAYPTIRLDTTEAEDRKALMDVTKTFVELGGEVEMTSLRDRLGLPEPSPGAKLLRAPNDIPGTQAAREVNRAKFAEEKPSGDMISELLDEALQDHWQELLDPVVGETLRRAQQAESYEDMARILSTLESDAGEVLDVEKLTRSLAKYTFAVRGAGSATDEIDG